MRHNGVLVSALQQSESAIHIYIYIYIYPHISSLPPLQAVTKHRADLPAPRGRPPPAIYLTFGSAHMSMPLSHLVPAHPSPSLCPQVHSLHLRMSQDRNKVADVENVRLFKNTFVCFSKQRLHRNYAINQL